MVLPSVIETSLVYSNKPTIGNPIVPCIAKTKNMLRFASLRCGESIPNHLIDSYTISCVICQLCQEFMPARMESMRTLPSFDLLASPASVDTSTTEDC